MIFQFLKLFRHFYSTRFPEIKTSDLTIIKQAFFSIIFLTLFGKQFQF